MSVIISESQIEEMLIGDNDVLLNIINDIYKNENLIAVELLNITNQLGLKEYGRADIVCEVKKCYKMDDIEEDLTVSALGLVVIELKTHDIGYEDLGQLSRYMSALSHLYFRFDFIDGIALCTGVNKFGDFVYLLEKLNDVNIVIYNFNINGFEYSVHDSDYFPPKFNIDYFNEYLKNTFGDNKNG